VIVLRRERSTGEPAETTERSDGPSEQQRLPIIAEALGYVGGALLIVGIGLAVGRSWADLSTGGRIGVVGAVAVGLLVAGAAVPRRGDPALERLRSALWVLSIAATALLTGIITHDALELEGGPSITFWVASVAAVQSATLWRGKDRPAVQTVCLIASTAALGALVTEFANIATAGLFVMAAGWSVIAVSAIDRLSQPVFSTVLGMIAAFVGAGMTSNEWTGVGLLIGVSSAAGLIALGTAVDPARPRGPLLRVPNGVHVALLIGGAVAAFQMTPGTIGYFAERAAIVTGAVTAVVGAVLLTTGIRGGVRFVAGRLVLGSIAIIGGSALLAVQQREVAVIVGLVAACALVVIGTRTDLALVTVGGAVGLVVNVPWALATFLPGEGRAPLVIAATGALIVVLAVGIARGQGRRANS
jgi:hypothetical protein